MADKLPSRRMRQISITAIILGVGISLLLYMSGVSLKSLFAGLQDSDTQQPINDQTSEGKAKGYIVDDIQPAAKTGSNASGTEDEIAGTGSARAELPAVVQQKTKPEILSPAAAEGGADLGDPTAVVLQQITAETPAPSAPVRAPVEMTDALKAIIEDQQREDKRRAERAYQASIAPLSNTTRTADELYGRDRRMAAALPRQQDDLSLLGEPQTLASGGAGQTGSLLAAGTVIHAALIDNIDSELPGLVRAIVTSNVWDTDTGREIVIPQGSQILGEYTNSTNAGQRRMGISWTRVRLPDGRAVDLDSAIGLDARGAVGVEGTRRNSFLTAVFQTALLNFAGSIGQTKTSGDASTLAQAAQLATGQGISQVGTQYINDRLSRGTVFRLKAGEIVNVQITRDFLFPAAYERQGAVSPDRSTNPGALVVPVSARTLSGSGAVPYNRELYGNWDDADGDCQTTRHELLQMLSTGPITLSADGCTVITGRWIDPYTGQTFTQARELDIDHLVPLAWAHARGGDSWDPQTRKRFANDPVNLFAVDAATNRAKGALGPDKWLPPDASFQCQYILRFIRVAQTYALTYFKGEEQAIGAVKERQCAA